MSHTKLERDKQKLIQDKCQQILTELLRDEDNKYCVDCDSKGPRWASWNLGIFLCIRCAGIHRNLGVHISKVKSVNLDSWTPEQVGSIQNMGNSKARAVYEANLPDNFSRPQADTALETFIRSKYEHKKYIAKEWVETQPKPAFDVETELKKEKEKKKNKIKPIAPISTQTEIQSNPIPRPTANVINGGKSEKGPTPSPTASASATTTTNQPQQKIESNQQPASADLLSLDLGGGGGGGSNEAFGNFFSSASQPVQPTTTNNNSGNPAQQTQPNKSLDDEEKDFFSQKTIEKKDEKKFTKESILSLYSQAPINNPASAMNGFPSHNMMPSMNQFTNVNPLFNSANPTNPMTSTNPFLANSNPLMAAGEKPSQNLVQGLSSLNLQSNQMPIGGRNPVASNTHSHLNWFQTPSSSSGPSNNATNSGGSGSLSVANPFMEQSSGKNLVNILDPQSNGNNILSATAAVGGDLISSSSTTTTATTANNPLDKINDNFNFW